MQSAIYKYCQINLIAKESFTKHQAAGIKVSVLSINYILETKCSAAVGPGTFCIYKQNPHTSNEMLLTDMLNAKSKDRDKLA